MLPFDVRPLSMWCDRYGNLPDDYFAVDTETSGIDPEVDRIIHLGWCIVKDRSAVFSAGVIINWPDHLPAPDRERFLLRIEETRQRMTDKGKAYPWTPALLRAKGVSPAVAAAKFLAVVGRDPVYAAHYGWLLDYPLLGRFIERYGEAEFSPQCHQLLDTGLLVKACLLGLRMSEGEPVQSYFRRVHSARGAPRHNLEACVDGFNLEATGADKKYQHGASDYDSWLVHLLIEKLRTYITGRGKNAETQPILRPAGGSGPRPT